MALARIMHQFSTAAPQSSVLTALRDPHSGTPGLLKRTLKCACGGLLSLAECTIRPALLPLRHENLCIIRASAEKDFLADFPTQTL